MFDQFKLWLLCLTSLFVLGACATNDAPVNYQVHTYVPRYINFSYNLNGKVHVTHSYLFGAGVKKCFYSGDLAEPYMEDYQLLYPYKSDKMKDYFEKDGHIYQGTGNADRIVFGYPRLSKTGSYTDPATGQYIEVLHHLWLFDPICDGYIGEFSMTLELRKSAYLSVEEDIVQTKEMLDNGWKELAHWEPEFTVKRGDNTWTVFKTYKKYYLGDATEEWYLPVAGGDYYYVVAFSYRTSTMRDDYEQYARGRDMFNHVLDSFVVRDLTPEEKAAIVNPTPVEIQPNQRTEVSRKAHEKYLQDLIDRLHRNDSK